MAQIVSYKRRGTRPKQTVSLPAYMNAGNTEILQKAVGDWVDSRNVRVDSPSYYNREPIIHWSTKNQSFLDVHHQLKMMGIRNNAFFLVLLNPLLENVDPHDPFITPEQAIMVVDECYHNFFYYIREVVRIPEQGGTNVMFRLDRGTLAAAWCFYNNQNYYLMKPRQTGKSVANCVFLSWAFKFGTTNSQFMFSANNDKNVKELLRKMKQYISLLPPYMAKMGSTKLNRLTGKTDRKTDNVKTYSEPRHGNVAFCARRGNTEEVAEEIGRGDSHGYEFFDEAEFTPFLDIIVQVSGPAFNTASKNIRDNGGHCCRIFSSTPGDLGDVKRGKRAMQIVDDCLMWSETFYDAGIDKVRELVENKTNYQIIYIEYNYKELGYGEEWFLDQCKNVGFNTAKIRREILLQRFTGNSRSPFSPDEITELVSMKKSPVWVDTIDALNEIKFYVPLEEIHPNRVYFVGCDPSEGTGGDHYSICVIDPYDMKVIAEFENSWMTPTGFIDLLEYITGKYFRRAIITIERNRNGATLIHFINQNPRLRRFIYHTPDADSGSNLTSEKLDEKGFIKESIAKTKHFGVNTGTDNRHIMMKLVVDAMHFNKQLLSTECMCRDVCDLVEINDKIQAAGGKHDDMVMAWCMAMYTLHYGDRLERFGFRKGELPDDIRFSDEFQHLEELYKNPYIQQQFPSMYAYYMNEVREKKLQETAEKKRKLKKRISTPGLGSIKSSIEKKERLAKKEQEDNFTLDMYNKQFNPDKSGDWKIVLMNRWRSLNK